MQVGFGTQVGSQDNDLSCDVPISTFCCVVGLLLYYSSISIVVQTATLQTDDSAADGRTNVMLVALESVRVVGLVSLMGMDHEWDHFVQSAAANIDKIYGKSFQRDWQSYRFLGFRFLFFLNLNCEKSKIYVVHVFIHLISVNLRSPADQSFINFGLLNYQ